MRPDVRPSPIAGTWYPGDADTLTRSVDEQLRQAEIVSPAGEMLGVIAPHAGHIYSGLVAAYAFQTLRNLRPEVVAVVSPLHQPYPGQVLTSGHEAYATPLGKVPVDRDLVGRLEGQLASAAGIHLRRVTNDQEHSLEIQLPFLQRALAAPFRLLPLMLRDQSHEAVEAVGHALSSVLTGTSAILVGSSDLSHFYPDPVARRLDAEVLARIEAFDPDGVLETEEKGVGFACGRGAVAAVLWAARDLGADSVQILRHATSADVTGDYASVVGYGAAAIYRARPGD